MDPPKKSASMPQSKQDAEVIDVDDEEKMFPNHIKNSDPAVSAVTTMKDPPRHPSKSNRSSFTAGDDAPAHYRSMSNPKTMNNNTNIRHSSTTSSKVEGKVHENVPGLIQWKRSDPKHL